jgi:hypothetical protein
VLGQTYPDSDADACEDHASEPQVKESLDSGYALRIRPITRHRSMVSPDWSGSAECRLPLGPAHRSAAAGVPPIREPAPGGDLPPTAGLGAHAAVRYGMLSPRGLPGDLVRSRRRTR